MAGVRQSTNRLLEMIEEGLLDKDTVIAACVNYMSEDDVAGMAHANEFFDDEEEDEEMECSHGCGFTTSGLLDLEIHEKECDG